MEDFTVQGISYLPIFPKPFSKVLGPDLIRPVRCRQLQFRLQYFHHLNLFLTFHAWEFPEWREITIIFCQSHRSCLNTVGCQCFLGIFWGEKSLEIRSPKQHPLTLQTKYWNPVMPSQTHSDVFQHINTVISPSVISDYKGWKVLQMKTSMPKPRFYDRS